MVKGNRNSRSASKGTDNEQLIVSPYASSVGKELTKEEAEELRRKELAILKASNEMLEKSLAETEKRKKKNEADMIRSAINENFQRLGEMGVTKSEYENVKYAEASEEFVKKFEERCKVKKINKEDLYNKGPLKEGSTTSVSTDLSIFNTEPNNVSGEVITSAERIERVKMNSDVYITDFDKDAQFDMLPLPSKGEVYPSKNSRVPVAYLTAADENLITSPNLYRDGRIIDVLLARKIMVEGLDVNTLCKGDRDAIVLWLRATGYGPDFSITVHDPDLDIDYDTTVDLTTIKMKPFNLKGDENGHFPYKLKNGDEIRFKFLNRYDEMTLTEMAKEDNLNIKRYRLNKLASELGDEIKLDKALSTEDRSKMENCVKTIENWAKNINVDEEREYEKTLTNSMILSIVSINGNTDRNYISKYVMRMPAGEAFRFRKYMMDNEPGMNFEITVNRPENLGGGSFTRFLYIDSSIFINIT